MYWLLILLLLTACVTMETTETKQLETENIVESPEKVETATFAGGCFWCVEADFEKHAGIIEVISGYTGGTDETPTYEEVSSHETGHLEAVQVTYDPNKTSYQDLLDIFWKQIDPTDDEGQFVDRGESYTTAIFYHDDEQKALAEQSKKDLEESSKFDKPIVTEIRPLVKFYPAEEYHQDFHKKHSLTYKFYRKGSGRDDFIEEHWSEEEMVDKKKEELKKKLTPLQYKVTQENGTERAFDNEYWDNHEEGIYVDIVSGEPLFSSLDKFESGTGWPSFTKPLVSDNIVEKEDRKFFMKRIEIRSRGADSHLGHVFNDGPEPTGLRYCMNSAALRFIPKEDFEKEGYGEFLKLFN